MFQSQKNVFWEALLVTILIFSLGIILGIFLENWRTNKVDILSAKAEIDLLDIRLQSDIYSFGNFNCQNAFDENNAFADKIYEEAKQLERYQQASVLTQDLVLSHKKYDILRAMLLLNSIKIKEKCNVSYNEIVYFYIFNNPSIELKAREGVFSKILGELKSKRGNKILLIPIAADNNITSIDLILNEYNISKSELPVILIDRKIKITQLESVNDLEKFLK